jgi:type I restriction enzyme S subunit
MARRRYSSYILSKTLWQKEIPSHWQETELRMLFADNKNKNIGLVERNLLSLSYGKLKRKDIDNATGLVPASFEGYQIIDEGYIVLRFTDLQNDKKSLRVGYVEEKGIITSAYIGLAPKADFDSKYYYYQLHFLDKIKYFYNLGGGVRQSLAFKEFGRETVLIPPKEEQTAIARFLDYKLAKINRFIQKKKQLIKLLNEQKAAIINQAVTKGLVANVKMKDSGIEWLGDIPEHWEVRKLKYLAKICNGSECDKQDEGLYPVYGSGGIFGYHSEYLYDKPSVLLGRKGTINKPMFVESPFWTVDTAFYTKIKDDLVLPYFFYLACTTINFDFYSTKTALPSMTQTSLYDVKIALPPLSEQQQIVSHIEKETAIINTTISKIEKELALTEEYKTALIAEAVTGKIDVRGYKVPEIMKEETYEEIEEEIGMVAENEGEFENE